MDIAHSARVWFDAASPAVAMFLLIANYFWGIVCGPLWLILGISIFAGDRRSRATARAVAEQGGDPPLVTPYARRALLLTFAIAGAVIASPALTLSLTWCLVRLSRAVSRERMSAGRQTIFTYLTITATSAVVLGAALLSHAFQWIV